VCALSRLTKQVPIDDAHLAKDQVMAGPAHCTQIDDSIRKIRGSGGELAGALPDRVKLECIACSFRRSIT